MKKSELKQMINEVINQDIRKKITSKTELINLLKSDPDLCIIYFFGHDEKPFSYIKNKKDIYNNDRDTPVVSNTLVQNMILRKELIYTNEIPSSRIGGYILNPQPVSVQKPSVMLTKYEAYDHYPRLYRPKDYFEQEIFKIKNKYFNPATRDEWHKQFDERFPEWFIDKFEFKTKKFV